MEKEETKNKLKVPIESEVQSSYLDYAMSVIVSRALPDVRDGLKPVQRRILYAMWRMGLKAGAKYRKSAAVVGETLAKFHPHGDLAVYGSLARMVQDFSLRYPLIDGQGNWGSIDGDPPAAQRYTECRLAKPAEEMLVDIEKEVVSFSSNYDGTLNEPQVLPAKLPNLLLNGSMGIAVGMATNIPPHNLKEVAFAIIHLIDHSDASLDSLLNILPGPDFPTGGIIFDSSQIKQVYALGRGAIVVRAKTEIQKIEAARWQIIISELPYQVNKADLLRSIAELVKDKRIEEIKNVRDESDKEGIRIVIELKKSAVPKRVQNFLFKFTDLESRFNVNMVALVDGIEPRLLNLKAILQEYIKHRQSVIKKRTEFDLLRTNERLHILNGLKIALQHIDEIIKIIKHSKDKEEAKKLLMIRYKLNQVQAEAILEMRLRELAGLERIKIEEELKEKTKLKKFLEEILASPKKILALIKEELLELVKKYADERRTKIIETPVGVFKEEDIIPDNQVLIGLTENNYIKRFSPELFRPQIRGGKGVIGFETKEEDSVKNLLRTTNHSDLFFFTNYGRIFKMKTYQIPEVSRTGAGQNLNNFLMMKENGKITNIISLHPKEKKDYLILVTKQGLIKKIKTITLSKIRQTGLSIIKLEKGDEIKKACFLDEKDEIILVTALGQSLRFKESNLRPMGRLAKGVRGIKLEKNDEVQDMGIIKFSKTGEVQKILVVTENGFGKLSSLNYYRIQNRAGFGIKAVKVSEKTGKLKSAIITDLYEQGRETRRTGVDLVIITVRGQVIRFSLDKVPLLSRSTQGVRLIRFKDVKDKVASVAVV